jgi:RNA polymerase sigma-70 factor (ECF subfamily)
MNNIHTLDPTQWVKHYSDVLLRFAYQRVGNREQAKDLVQETFLAALRNKDSFHGDISEKNWLYLILKNKIIDAWRGRKHEFLEEVNRQAEETADFFDEAGHWKEKHYPQDWRVMPAENLESSEFHRILEKCLTRLKQGIQVVFRMKYLEEIEAEDICKELDISTSNYWVMIHRSKLQLRVCLEKNWFDK